MWICAEADRIGNKVNSRKKKTGPICVIKKQYDSMIYLNIRLEVNFRGYNDIFVRRKYERKEQFFELVLAIRLIQYMLTNL